MVYSNPWTTCGKIATYQNDTVGLLKFSSFGLPPTSMES